MTVHSHYLHERHQESVRQRQSPDLHGPYSKPRFLPLSSAPIQRSFADFAGAYFSPINS
jgi:hypothetical protein